MRVSSTLVRLGLLLLLSTALQGTGRAVAQDQPAPADPGTDIGEPDPSFHTPFTQYPDDPGALRFEELGAAQQAAVMEMAERSDLGPEVHAAWSAVTRAAAAEAKVKRAAYETGTVGLDEVGVP